jgi:hypothetical protein
MLRGSPTSSLTFVPPPEEGIPMLIANADQITLAIDSCLQARTGKIELVPSTNTRIALAATLDPNGMANNAIREIMVVHPACVMPQDVMGSSGLLSAKQVAANRDQVAFGFLNSVEERINLITSYYEHYLGRSPDSGGLSELVVCAGRRRQAGGRHRRSGQLAGILHKARQR